MPVTEPLFKVGDRVISFRQEKGTVTEVIKELAAHRSHKVGVEWDDKTKNPDKRVYYEGVFEPL